MFWMFLSCKLSIYRRRLSINRPIIMSLAPTAFPFTQIDNQKYQANIVLVLPSKEQTLVYKLTQLKQIQKRLAIKNSNNEKTCPPIPPLSYTPQRKERQLFQLFQINSKPNNFYSKIINMASKQAMAVLITLLSLAFSLHIHNPALHQQQINQQLVALRNQQSAFEKEVAGLIDDIRNIQLKVNASTTTNQKVLILETAILSEREKIFKLQNSIIPPFNLSKNACKQLTNQQKIKMLDQLQKAKDEIAKLKAIAAKIPTNAEVASVTSDIAKQQTLLQGISKAIFTQCQTTIVFSPTIFQTNLFATNWILGKQSIDNIVEQYYQRSRLYHNVTNCPLDFPFYDGTKCIKCQQPTPIFDMQLSHCQKCPYDTRLNSDKHLCQQIPHFTDYKKLDNFILDGAILPAAPTDGTTSCPPLRPYFDGKCVACALPSYWNVKQNKCKDCPAGQVFNTNTKNCTTPQGNTLSYLQGNSRWVGSSGGFSAVLKERGDLIKNSPSKYSICGKDSPYFDGIACISCPFQFNLTQKKCVSAPAGSVYNPNLHQYVTPLAGKQTNPNATNLLSTNPLPQTSHPCDAKTPFYDGVTCIQCPQPFTLFNTTTKKCSRCSPWQLYNSKTLKCTNRPVVMVSSNFNNLLGSLKTNLSTYKAQLLNKVKNNGDNIIKQCAADQYSNYTHCFKCQPTERFNVQTKKCDTCNGTVDNNTLICDPLKTMLTDLTANNLIVGPNSNLTAYATAQKQVQGPILKCPPQTPYAVGGLKCMACTNATTPYFDLQSQKCISCPDRLFLNSASHRCQKEIFITNVAAIKKVIQVKNYTAANVKLQLQNLSKTRKTVLCNESTPLATAAGDKCYACEPLLGYYNLKTKECVPGIYVTNITELKATGRVIQSDGRTLQAIAMELKAINQPQVTCPKEKPYSDGQACIVCPAGQYYYLKNNSCYEPKLVSDFKALQQSGRVVQMGGATLQGQKDQIKNAGLPVNTCPVDKPLSDGSKCMACAADKYYNIKDKNCFDSITVTNIDALKKINKVIEEANSTLATLQAKIAQAVKPKICPQATPLFNGSACISCPAGNYYVLSNSTCYNPKLVTNVALLTASKNYVQSGGVTLQQLQDSINKQKLPVAPCPNQAPLFNGTKCIGCAVQQYYGLQKKACLNVTVVSNTDAITLQNNYLQNDNSTLQNLGIANKKIAQPKRVCPADVPMYNGTNCIACKQSLYNIQLSQCSNCAPDFYYDSPTHKCLKKPDYYPNLNNDQWIVSSDAGLVKVGQLAKQRSAIKGSAMCPQDKPHFNNNTKTCETCAKDTFWNYQTNTCMSCAAGQEVDRNTRKCAKRSVGEHQTSLASPRLLFDGLPKAQFQDQYDSNKNKYPNIQDCPKEKPYFDGFGCIQCPPSNPLFSMLSKLCSSCPANSIYDQQNKYCYSGKQLKTSGPTTGKMYSSIF